MTIHLLTKQPPMLNHEIQKKKSFGEIYIKTYVSTDFLYYFFPLYF